MHSIRENLYYLFKKVGEKQRRTQFLKKFYEVDMKRFNKCDERKASGQMKHEQNILHNYWGCKPYQYYYYNFYRKDCTLTIEDMKKYIPDYFAYYIFYPRIYKDYGILCDDKGLLYTTLKGYNINQPNMLFRFENDKFYDEYNGSITSTKVNELINLSKSNKIFVKPVFGSGGKGILVFKRKDNYFYNEENMKLEYDFIKKEINDGPYLVQEGIVQSDEMNNIYSHSVNTLRLFTECVNGEPKLLLSLLRMGCGGKQVDNAHSGGLYIKVDPVTGVLSDFAYAKNHVKCYEHPDTNFKFKDYKLTNWEEIKKFILTPTEKFRNIKYLGWDVAYTENGPIVIETNECPDIGIMQDHFGGLSEMFNINPKEWWYNSKYTIREL